MLIFSSFFLSFWLQTTRQQKPSCQLSWRDQHAMLPQHCFLSCSLDATSNIVWDSNILVFRETPAARIICSAGNFWNQKRNTVTTFHKSASKVVASPLLLVGPVAPKRGIKYVLKPVSSRAVKGCFFCHSWCHSDAGNCCSSCIIFPLQQGSFSFLIVRSCSWCWVLGIVLRVVHCPLQVFCK